VITCAVQSSSVTTVLVVVFTSALLLTLGQSLGVIFGANIGTTTTGWLVSLLGFKVKISAFAIPLIGIGFFSRFIRRWSLPHKIGQAMVGFGLLFLGLQLLKDAIPDVKDSPQIMEWIAQIEPNTLVGILAAIAFGTVITLVVQSSSAAMAITLTAAAKGYIDFPTACAITLGENIGTTVTAALASIGAPTTARRAALGHFLFNFLGVAWVIVLFRPILALVDSIVPGDPNGLGETALLVAIPTHIAAFHTTFNVLNTALFLPLIRLLERLIRRLIPDGIGETDEVEHELVYLTTAFGSAPELAIASAEKEVSRMAGVTIKMISRIHQAISATGSERERLLHKIRGHEHSTDVLEHKISEYLAELVHGQLSSVASRSALSLMSMINDLERIGDHGEKISFVLEKEDGESFSDEARAELLAMAELTHQNLDEMRRLILDPEDDPLPAAWDRENALNDMRTRLRRNHLKRMGEGRSSAQAGIRFMDLITSFEKMGDHSFNVIEATVGLK
jgi:phosphate:Na+ symporter